MKSTDHLMELIHSLTPSEKRYFKLYAERHKGQETNNYIRLFNYLEKLDDFDEKKIKAHFKQERFLNQLPVAKNYLYNMLLKSLSSFHQEETRFEELHRLVHYIKILHGKNLLVQANKWLRKAEEMAEEYQYYPILLDLLELRTRIIHDTSFEGVEDEELDRLEKLEEEALHHIRLLSKINWLGLQIYKRHWQKRYIRSKDEYLKEFKELFEHTELRNDPGPKNLIARYFYLSFNSTFYLLTGDMDKCIELSRKAYEVFQQNKFLIAEHPQIFFTAVNNYAIALLQTDRLIENAGILKALDDIKKPTEFLRGRILYCQHAFAFYAHFMRSDLQNTIPHADKLRQWLPLFENFILRRDLLTLYYNLALFYFDFGRHEESLDFVNVLLQRKDLNTVPDIASFARILQIINLMELKSDDVLPYFIRSTLRYMSTHKQLFEVEKIFLKYLKSLAAAKDDARFLKVLTACKKELEPYVKVPYEQNAFQYFDFITWIESKMEKISFAQMIEKKYKATVKEKLPAKKKNRQRSTA